jgi:D-alanyl-D-alanine carboxypeptidase (penicillin-binding protein 5/6)
MNARHGAMRWLWVAWCPSGRKRRQGDGLRWAAVGLVAGLVSLTVGLAAAAAQTLSDRLLPLIAGHRGEVAVAVEHLPSGTRFVHRADEPMPTASLIKLPIMVEVYRQAAEGRVDLDERLTFREEDRTPGSGILTPHFSPGATLTLRDAVRLMIAFSDNAATNLVLGRIGLSATNQTMEALGLPNTRVHAFVFRPASSIAPERSRQFGLGSTTAAEMLQLLKRLDAGELVSREACAAMREHLRQCQDRRMGRLLPPGVKVAHKTGSVAAVRTDAGLIEAPSGTIALCVLTRNNEDQRFSEENAAEVLTARIGRAVYDFFEEQRSARPAAPREVPDALRVGSSGWLVQALQRTLNRQLSPSPALTVDGDFGPATEAAVKAFQQARGLPVTGVVDAATFRALGPLAFEDDPAPAEAPPAELAPLAPAESLDGPPLTTCKAWAIADAATGRLLWGQQPSQRLDMASTTKIMTAWIVCQLAQADAEILQQPITFSAAADGTPGSTADLKAGETTTVGDLLYGLLLPSGNDAAVALAEHFGPRFAPAEEAKVDESANPAARPDAASAPSAPLSDAVQRFVAEMNRRAAQLGLADTHYANPHGLTARGHYSSAGDLAQLAHVAMQDPLFRKVVSTRQHQTTVRGPGGYERQVTWRNTNRLLGIDGYQGVKTGTTNAAGACLVAWGRREGRELIVVVLGATSGDARYVDARNLFRWAWSQTQPAASKP